MKIAFATDNNKEINMHFGLTRRFAVYEISASGFVFLGAPTFQSTLENNHHDDFGDDKIQTRIDALQECAIVYCTQIGGVAAARLVKNKIHPVKVEAGQTILSILIKLQERLANNPPLWLQKVLAQESPMRKEKVFESNEGRS